MDEELVVSDGNVYNAVDEVKGDDEFDDNDDIISEGPLNNDFDENDELVGGESHTNVLGGEEKNMEVTDAEERRKVAVESILSLLAPEFIPKRKDEVTQDSTGPTDVSTSKDDFRDDDVEVVEMPKDDLGRPQKVKRGRGRPKGSVKKKRGRPRKN